MSLISFMTGIGTKTEARADPPWAPRPMPIGGRFSGTLMSPTPGTIIPTMGRTISATVRMPT